MVLINLSGHPAPKGAETAFEAVVDIPVPNVDLGSAAAVAEAAKDLIKKALASEAREAVLRGEVAVILPGATALAAPVLAALVGVSGVFPKLYWAVKGPEGFSLSEGLELQVIRLEARALRES